jgi:protein SCO1/2
VTRGLAEKWARPVFLLIGSLSCVVIPLHAGQSYPIKGLLLKVDSHQKTMLVSIDAIPGYMEAMTMPFSVRDVKQLDFLVPGSMIDFTLVVEKDTSYADAIRMHRYEGLEPDPLAARRLKLLNEAANPSKVKPVAVGSPVPDFSLIDQNRRAVTLSKFAGKVVLLNFIYTRCALPNFCFRSSNNFGLMQKRFRSKLGRKLVLLTVSFDPVHDQPEALAKYAKIWKADPSSWHFLTGSAEDVRRVCDLFGEDFFQDEGLMNHSLHTAVIDPNRKLIANLEGNEFSAQQLGDLLDTVLSGGPR